MRSGRRLLPVLARLVKLGRDEWETRAGSEKWRFCKEMKGLCRVKSEFEQASQEMLLKRQSDSQEMDLVSSSVIALP